MKDYPISSDQFEELCDRITAIFQQLPARAFTPPFAVTPASESDSDSEYAQTILDYYERERFVPYSGEQFLSDSSPENHPFSLAFIEFLGLGLHPDIANILAFGFPRFDLICLTPDDPTRAAAHKIFGCYLKAGYWGTAENPA